MDFLRKHREICSAVAALMVAVLVVYSYGSFRSYAAAPEVSNYRLTILVLKLIMMLILLLLIIMVIHMYLIAICLLMSLYRIWNLLMSLIIHCCIRYNMLMVLIIYIGMCHLIIDIRLMSERLFTRQMLSKV